MVVIRKKEDKWYTSFGSIVTHWVQEGKKSCLIFSSSKIKGNHGRRGWIVATIIRNGFVNSVYKTKTPYANSDENGVLDKSSFTTWICLYFSSPGFLSCHKMFHEKDLIRMLFVCVCLCLVSQAYPCGTNPLKVAQKLADAKGNTICF